MDGRNQNQGKAPGSVHDADELRQLIVRLTAHDLHEDFALPTQQDLITTQDVAEALSLPLRQVEEALEEIQREAYEARISQALREVEEPLYRVERGAPKNPDVLDSDPIYRLRSVQILADRARTKFKREEKVKHEDNHAASLVANLILVSLVALLVLLIGKAIYMALLQV